MLVVELSRTTLRPCFQPRERPPLLTEIKAIRMLMRLRGDRLPGLLIRDNLKLPRDVYRILLADREVGRGVLPLGRVQAVGSPIALAQLAGEPNSDLALGVPGKWVAGEDRPRAERLGCLIRTPASVIANHVGLIVRRHAAELNQGKGEGG